MRARRWCSRVQPDEYRLNNCSTKPALCAGLTRLLSPSITIANPHTMSMFRAKKLDLGCFTKIRNIRDHTKRKVFEQFEPER